MRADLHAWYSRWLLTGALVVMASASLATPLASAQVGSSRATPASSSRATPAGSSRAAPVGSARRAAGEAPVAASEAAPRQAAAASPGGVGAAALQPDRAEGKRPVPDYGGRGHQGRGHPSPLILVPRMVLAPLYVTTEYLINRPLGWLFTTVERERFPGFLWDLLSGPSTMKLTVVPSAYVDFGFRPSVGAYVIWDEAFHRRHDLRLGAVTWGADWLDLSFADRIHLQFPDSDGQRTSLWIRGEFIRRQDRIHHGPGPRAPTADEARFASQFFDGNVGLDHRTGHGLRLRGFAGFRVQDYAGSDCCSEPSITRAAEQGRFPLPPGFAEGFAAPYLRGEITYETRRPRPSSQSGIRLQAEARASYDVRDENASWIRYRGTAGGFLDVTGTSRVLGLILTGIFAEPFSGLVPFTEQARLGGSRYLRAFRTGRLVDRSAIVATLQYEWPVWLFLDGILQYSLGNVFASQLSDFELELLRQSVAAGLRTNNHPAYQLELTFGVGSTPIAEGSRFDSTRLYIGLTRGF